MLTYLFFGITIGMIISALFIYFVVPIIQIVQDVYLCKQSNNASNYSIDMQRKVMEFNREFPEAIGNQTEAQAIGYRIDNDYYEDEEELKINNIGFKS